MAPRARPSKMSAAKFCEGPSRPASCDTARPARRAGQPQNNQKNKKHTPPICQQPLKNIKKPWRP
nr:hypothetical protein [Saprospira grandis]